MKLLTLQTYILSENQFKIPDYCSKGNIPSITIQSDILNNKIVDGNKMNNLELSLLIENLNIFSIERTPLHKGLNLTNDPNQGYFISEIFYEFDIETNKNKQGAIINRECREYGQLLTRTGIVLITDNGFSLEQDVFPDSVIIGGLEKKLQTIAKQLSNSILGFMKPETKNELTIDEKVFWTKFPSLIKTLGSSLYKTAFKDRPEGEEYYYNSLKFRGSLKEKNWKQTAIVKTNYRWNNKDKIYFSKAQMASDNININPLTTKLILGYLRAMGDTIYKVADPKEKSLTLPIEVTFEHVTEDKYITAFIKYRNDESKKQGKLVMSIYETTTEEGINIKECEEQSKQVILKDLSKNKEIRGRFKELSGGKEFKHYFNGIEIDYKDEFIGEEYSKVLKELEEKNTTISEKQIISCLKKNKEVI